MRIWSLKLNSSKSNKSLAGNKVKNEIEQLLLKYKLGNDKHEHEKQRSKWTSSIFFNLSRRVDLRSSNKHVALQNVSIYYKWKNMRK